MKTTKTTDELVKDFLQERDVSDRSRNVYRNILNQWFRWLSSKGYPHGSVSRVHVMEYKAHLVAKHTAKTANNYLTALRLYYKWLKEKSYYHTNPTEGVRAVRRSAGHRKKYLTTEQIQLLLAAPSDKTERGIRDRAIMRLMLTSGLRAIEVCRASVGDIVNQYLFIQRKGRSEKDAKVPLSNSTIDAIEKYLMLRDSITDEQPLFCNASRRDQGRMKPYTISVMVRGYLNSIGITDKQVTAHSLRHTFASHALMAGVPLLDVSTMMGHADVSTTQIYLRQVQAETVLKKFEGDRVDQILHIS